MNNYDGSFFINDRVIHPLLTKDNFLRNFADELEDKEISSNIFEFAEPTEINGLSFYVSFIFIEDVLRGVNLSNSDEKLRNSYANWSNERNRLKRESHDGWVKNQFGEPFKKSEVAFIVTRDWGEVTSYTDMKGGNVGISIIYK